MKYKVVYTAEARQALGRLFLCLAIFSDRIAKTKTSYKEGNTYD